MTRTEKENLVPVWERITISINFGIDKNEMKLLVIALAELDLTIDEWLCFR